MRSLSDISPELKSKLDSHTPCWEDLVDQHELLDVCHKEIFNEEWLLEHLRNNALIGTHKKINDKREEIFSKAYEDPQFSVLEAMQEYSEFAEESMDQLIKSKAKFDEIYEEFKEKWEQQKIIKTKADIEKSVKAMEKKIETESKIYEEVVIGSMERNIVESIREFRTENTKAAIPVIKKQIEKLKEVNRKSIESQKGIIDLIKEIVLSQLPSIKEFGSFFSLIENIKLSETEEERLNREVKKVVTDTVREHQRVRTEAVNAILSKSVGKSTSQEIKDYFQSSEHLEPEHKEVLSAVIDSGYVISMEGDEEEEETTSRSKRSTEAKAKSTSKKLSKYCISWGNIARIVAHLLQEKEYVQHRIDSIYESDLYRFCNGGWWATFAHIGTLGFCTGATIGANLAGWMIEQKIDIDGLITSIETILLFAGKPVPLKKLFLKESLKKIAKAAFREVACYYVVEYAKKAIDLLREWQQ